MRRPVEANASTTMSVILTRESEASVQNPENDVRPSTAKRVRLATFAVLTASFVGLCVALTVPFLPAVTWGVALSIVAWPMCRGMIRRGIGPLVASLLTTAIVVVLILGPCVFVAVQLANEVSAAAGQVDGLSEPGKLQEQLTDIPGLGEIQVWLDKIGVNIETEVRNLAVRLTNEFAGLAQGSLVAILQFLLVAYFVFYLLRDRVELLGALREMLPLSRAESEKVFETAADSVHANLFATVLTSLIDATTGGLIWWWLGLPTPVLWAMVLFVLAVLPILGSAMVWVPTVVALAIGGATVSAGVLLAWGLLTFILIDNLLYVRLAGTRMEMHPVPAMIAFLGGIAIFGLSGIVLGPAIVALTAAILDVWKQRLVRS